MKKNLLISILSLFVASASAQAPANPEDISPLLIGETLPDVTLGTIEGKEIKTSSLWPDKKTIIIFYRGSWCPYCNTHLAEVGQIENDLIALGYKIVAISPDAPENLKKSIDKNKLNYELYSDADMSFAKACGLAFKAPERYHKRLPEDSGGKNTELLLPVPTLFIVNEKGEILFEYINPNYRVRISGEMMLAVAKALSGKG